MDVLDPDDLPMGLLRVDSAGIVVDANAAFREWADSDSPVGRPLSDFLVPIDDFIDGGRGLGMMAPPDRLERAAFVIEAVDGITFTVIDASERYAAGQALRSAHLLADRTRTRLQLVIDASIAFAQATTEERLAEILASTAALAYRAEESAVYLADSDMQLTLVSGSNPFANIARTGDSSFDVLRLREVLKISTDDEATAVTPELPAAMLGVGVHAMIAAPLHLDREMFGVFACFFHHPRQFDDEAAPLADALAGQAAQALATIRLQRQLEHAAKHDETTGLPNRRLLEEQISQYSDGRRLAVMFIDLDGFKSINDQFGHFRGDDVLREVARRLHASVREPDIVARYGGDEFVVVCDLPDGRVVADLAERLRTALEAPYPLLPTDARLTASIGVAVGAAGIGAWPVDRLIRNADQAMYVAKLSGGNQVADMDTKLSIEVSRRAGHSK